MSRKIKPVIIAVVLLIAIFFATIIYSLYKEIKEYMSISDSDPYSTVTVSTLSVNTFFDNAYLEYNGGKDAAVFFDEYAYVDEYKDIAFYYKDRENSFQIDSSFKHTIFALDVYYDEDTFLEVSNHILLEITGESAEEIFELYDGGQIGAFRGYKIEKEESVYQKNNAAVLFDPIHNTIRYAFLCNNVGDIYDVFDALAKVLGLNWNSFENSWVFDYSDITSTEVSSDS